MDDSLSDRIIVQSFQQPAVFPHTVKPKWKSSNSLKQCSLNNSQLVLLVTSGNNEKVDVMKCSVGGLLRKNISGVWDAFWSQRPQLNKLRRKHIERVGLCVCVRETPFVIRPITGHQLTTLSLGQVLSTWLCGMRRVCVSECVYAWRGGGDVVRRTRTACWRQQLARPAGSGQCIHVVCVCVCVCACSSLTEAIKAWLWFTLWS